MLVASVLPAVSAPGVPAELSTTLNAPESATHETSGESASMSSEACTWLQSWSELGSRASSMLKACFASCDRNPSRHHGMRHDGSLEASACVVEVVYGSRACADMVRGVDRSSESSPMHRGRVGQQLAFDIRRSSGRLRARVEATGICRCASMGPGGTRASAGACRAPKVSWSSFS